MATHISGKFGSVVVDTNYTLCVTEWDATIMCDLLDVTSTCSGGHRELISGIDAVDATVKAHWDKDLVLFDGVDGISLNPGLNAVFRLWYGATGGSENSLLFTGYIESVRIANVVRGTVTYEMVVKSSGNFFVT